MHRKKQKPTKLVDRCVDCKIQLKKNNRHHFRCEKCWEEFQIKKGNIALLGGV